MSIFTAWVCIGMVMINMIKSTSITSISGVVFISISGRDWGTVIRRATFGEKKGRLPAGNRPLFPAEIRLEDAHIIFVADEAHLLDVRLLGDRQNAIDQLVARRRIGLQVKLRNRI